MEEFVKGAKLSPKEIVEFLAELALELCSICPIKEICPLKGANGRHLKVDAEFVKDELILMRTATQAVLRLLEEMVVLEADGCDTRAALLNAVKKIPKVHEYWLKLEKEKVDIPVG